MAEIKWLDLDTGKYVAPPARPYEIKDKNGEVIKPVETKNKEIKQ